VAILFWNKSEKLINRQKIIQTSKIHSKSTVGPKIANNISLDSENCVDSESAKIF
jgi:hypothetical protein